MAEPLRILFVCMGNICRSPMAEGVFRKLVAEAGLAEHVHLDSAGTIAYHEGEPPDGRAIAAARRRGVDIGTLQARALRPEDCGRFDLVLAMDRKNLERVRALCGEGLDARLFLEFAPGRRGREVPDPYGGGSEGFEHALDLIEAAARGLLTEVRRRLQGETA